MAEQRFTNAFREALWRAFGQRCFYCELPLTFSAMEIDHLIPQATSQAELSGYRSRLGLPSMFSLVDFENLAPSCSDCNKKKRALPLADGALMIKLAQIAANRPKLVAELERKRASRDLDAVLRLIQHSIDAGEFSATDLSRGIEFLRRHPDGLHGSSGKDRTPPSPEIGYMGRHFLDDGAVLLSSAAINDLERLDLSVGDLLNLIRGFSGAGQIRAQRLPGETPLYQLRLSDTLRVVFTPKSESTTLVVSILDKR